MRDETGPIQFWSGMVHDSNLWWDGWYWSVVGTETVARAPRPTSATSGCAEAQFPFNGPNSVNCIFCHASAVSTSPGAGTYSTPTFINPTSAGAAGSIPADAQLPAFAMHSQRASRSGSGIGIHRPAPELDICQCEDAPPCHDTVYAASATGFRAPETCQGGGAFAVRYFRSMRQLPRRYLRQPTAHQNALYSSRIIDSG